MLKGILIDPFEKCIKEIEFPRKQIAKQIDCSLFTIIKIDNKNDLFLDDEGYLHDQSEQEYFWWQGYPQMLAGKALVLGCKGPDTVSVRGWSVEDVQKKVKFQSKETSPMYMPDLTPQVFFLEKR